MAIMALLRKTTEKQLNEAQESQKTNFTWKQISRFLVIEHNP